MLNPGKILKLFSVFFANNALIYFADPKSFTSNGIFSTKKYRATVSSLAHPELPLCAFGGIQARFSPSKISESHLNFSFFKSILLFYPVWNQTERNFRDNAVYSISVKTAGLKNIHRQLRPQRVSTTYTSNFACSWPLKFYTRLKTKALLISVSGNGKTQLMRLKKFTPKPCFRPRVWFFFFPLKSNDLRSIWLEPHFSDIPPSCSVQHLSPQIFSNAWEFVSSTKNQWSSIYACCVLALKDQWSYSSWIIRIHLLICHVAFEV